MKHYSNFYLKIKNRKVYIEEDNVYTICPECGKEHVVDLVEVISSGDTDLYSTQVYCRECSERGRRQ